MTGSTNWPRLRRPRLDHVGQMRRVTLEAISHGHIRDMRLMAIKALF
jgi:hypothetical protein